VTQVYALVDAGGLRYRALILLAAFTSLLWAELAALRPEDVDLDGRTVRLTRQLHYHQASNSFGPPKSRAGVRVVSFPDLIVPEVRKHLEWLPVAAPLVFATSTGSPLAHSNFRIRVAPLLWPLSAWKASTCTTCDTPATSSPPTRERISKNSWPGWATTASALR
jgi:integrase